MIDDVRERLMREIEETLNILERFGYEASFNEHNYKMIIRSPKTGGVLEIPLKLGGKYWYTEDSSFEASLIESSLEGLKEAFSLSKDPSEFYVFEEVVKKIIVGEKDLTISVENWKGDTVEFFDVDLFYSLKCLVDLGFKLRLSKGFYGGDTIGVEFDYPRDAVNHLFRLHDPNRLRRLVRKLLWAYNSLEYWDAVADVLPERDRVHYLLKTSKPLTKEDAPIVREMLDSGSRKIIRSIIRKLAEYDDKVVKEIFIEHINKHDSYHALKLLDDFRATVGGMLSPEDSHLDFVKHIIVKALNLPEEYKDASLTCRRRRFTYRFGILRLQASNKLPTIEFEVYDTSTRTNVKFFWKTLLGGAGNVAIKYVDFGKLDRDTAKKIIEATGDVMKLYQKIRELEFKVGRKLGKGFITFLYISGEKQITFKPEINITLTVKDGKLDTSRLKQLVQRLEKIMKVTVGGETVTIEELLSNIPKRRMVTT